MWYHKNGVHNFKILLEFSRKETEKMDRWNIFLVFFLIVAAAGCSDRGRGLSIDPFPGVVIERIICFHTETGDISWKCSPGEIKQYACPDALTKCEFIGFGYFSGSSAKATIVFKNTGGLLTANAARSMNCKCSSRGLKGKILQEFLKYRGLSAKSPLLLQLAPIFAYCRLGSHRNF